jgi:formate hydrogenlyase subunit 4
MDRRALSREAETAPRRSRMYRPVVVLDPKISLLGAGLAGIETVGVLASLAPIIVGLAALGLGAFLFYEYSVNAP